LTMFLVYSSYSVTMNVFTSFLLSYDNFSIVNPRFLNY